ncbi:hypothetical protein DN752_11050 [Echinicola strongylocentroti]|uniref:SIMPL domain-containing protein n=1 Tax=Echinicola strongylocentroti TaxID=1795355 RepID=A0A2Z4IJA9_9BACT|nr:SIMPL domain-containing protein [Echinicola strongylocentroti]AWW30616.1 hypothetical protein DN752_11050 [Echinicola strongylocentroti]
MHRLVVKYFLFAVLGTGVISCNLNQPNATKTIALIGVDKVTFEEVAPCINVSFNGNLDQKKALESLMKGTEMAKFRVDITSENFYKDGGYDSKTGAGDFTYGISYTVVLNKATEKDLISKLLAENKLPVNINSSGYYLSPQKNKALQDIGFQKALANAKSRINAYADSLGMQYEVMDIEEIDDYQLYPANGIIYTDELVKKVKVKAHLTGD